MASNTTIWQYRRKKRRILSPVSRGLIVGTLFCGWLAYSLLYKGDFDLVTKNDGASESFPDIFNLNSERIVNDLEAPLRLDRLGSKTVGIRNQMNLLQKGK